MTAEELQELDDELNSMILSGQAMDAFEKFYAEDISMQENSDEPFVGKDLNRKREQEFFASVEEFHGTGISGAGVGDDKTFCEIWMDVTFKGGQRMKLQQVAVRTWKDGLVSQERFYYNKG